MLTYDIHTISPDTWDDAAIGVGETEAAAYAAALASLLGDWDITSLPSAADAGLDSETVAPDGRRYCVVVRVRQPRCGCTSCGCDSPATTLYTDVPVCATCAAYCSDGDGDQEEEEQ